VKVLVSSRNDQYIVFHLEHYPNLELSPGRNSDDISSFVKVERQNLIRRGALLRFSANKEELREVIIDKVTKGANGM
jgi:hypothetical protein